MLVSRDWLMVKRALALHDWARLRGSNEWRLALNGWHCGVLLSHPVRAGAESPLGLRARVPLFIAKRAAQAISAGIPMTANMTGSPNPSATIQPPATTPTNEPIRPIPDAQLTPVARLAVG